MRKRIRSLVCKSGKHTSVVTTVTPFHPAFRTQWLERLAARKPPTTDPEVIIAPGDFHAAALPLYEERTLAMPHGARRGTGISRSGPSAWAHSGEVAVRFAARMRLLERERPRRPKAASRIARSAWSSARAE